MIDEQRTLEIYGYVSDDLTKGSNKFVVRVCDECGRDTDVMFYNYNRQKYPDLCLSCAQKKRFEDPDECIKHSKRAFKQFSTQEARDKVAESMKRYYLDPLNRKKASDKANKRWENPDERKKASESMKKRMADPLNREKLSASHKKLWEDPAFREKVSGENSYAWQGGISYGKYCPKFNDEIKQRIRDKYNNCDYISGIHKDVCSPNRAFDVHHIDYDKQQGCDDHEWRLIPLSAVNHIRTNYNRSFWNRLFTYSLQYDEIYYDDEPMDIWGC